MNFAERIVEIKNSRKLLQKDIAKAVKVTARNYHRYETGEQQPTLPVIIRIAEYFDVSIDYLVGRTDDPKVYKK